MNDISYAAFADELEKLAKGTQILSAGKTLVQRLAGGAAKAAPAAEQAAGRAAQTVGKATKAGKDFSLAGERAIGGAPAQSIIGGSVPSAGNINKTLQEAARTQRAQQWTVAAREGRINKALQAGTLDPKLHNIGEFGRTGNLVGRTPAPARAARTVERTQTARFDPSAATKVRPGAVSPAATAPVQGGQGAWYQDPRVVGGAMGAGGLGYGLGTATAG